MSDHHNYGPSCFGGGASQTNVYLWPCSNFGLFMLCVTVIAVTAIICFS